MIFEKAIEFLLDGIVKGFDLFLLAVIVFVLIIGIVGFSFVIRVAFEIFESCLEEIDDIIINWRER